MNIVNVGYDSTNYYVLADTKPRLLIDAGWPGTMPKFAHQCQRMGIGLPEIKHVFVTHFHPDHAGLVHELKRGGAKILIMDVQRETAVSFKDFLKPEHRWVDLGDDNAMLTCAESRAFLKTIGVDGEIVPTPGHSDDSVTLVLDSGDAFTGDLAPALDGYDDPVNAVLRRSWETLSTLGAKTIYPGHGPVRPLLFH